ncbi:MAG: glycosyltransferase family 9 protein [Anaerolineae bacterium]|nr:glycosyltransferase family 9 protein [Anaerolineae bacterium]
MANRFLIVQLADIGDLILSTPALSALREAHPDAHIALLTTAHAAPIIADTQLVDEIITFDRKAFNSSYAFFRPANLRRVFALRAGRYDTVLFFHHFTLKLGTLKFALIALASGAKRRLGLENGNGWFLTHRLTDGGFGAKHQAQYWLDLVAQLGANPTPRPAVISTVSPSLSTERGLGGEVSLPSSTALGTSPQVSDSVLSTQYSVLLPTIIIHAGSGGYNRARRWEPAHFAAVADALHREFNAQIILVGGKGDDTEAVKAAMQTQPLDLTAQTTLPELAGIIQKADLFIGADSGVMHIAAAIGTPVIAVFGPSNPDAWGAWTPNGTSIIVRSAPECSPCSYVEHSIGLREGCPARTCMRMVTPEHVLTATRQILNKQPIPTTSKPTPKSTRPNRIHILDLPVDPITYTQLLNLIDEWISSSPRPKNLESSTSHLASDSVLSTQYLFATSAPSTPNLP